MQRRQLLKMAPLAALAVLPIKTEGAQPTAFELRNDKKYIFIFESDVTREHIDSFSECAMECGVKGFVIVGPHPIVYEVDAK